MTNEKGKLHALLAVEGALKSAAQRAVAECRQLFDGGKGRFLGQQRIYVPLDENGETMEPQVQILGTTVAEELGVVATVYGKWLDAALQKEITNTGTLATLETADELLNLADLPATALLNLEGKLAEIRSLIAAIPTNDPAKQWEWDTQQGCYVAAPETSYRTEKEFRTHVEYEATPEHPAQVQTFAQDRRIGTWTTTHQSGMITTARARILLQRVDNLIAATKRARMRANDCEVTSVHIAEDIFAYILRE